MSGIENIKHYLAMRKAKPLGGMAEILHWIHTGEEWEAEITLADLREAVDAIDALKARVAELEGNIDHDRPPQRPVTGRPIYPKNDGEKT